MNRYEIWMEGFSVTGQYKTAQKIGEGIGNNFDEAVKDYMTKNKDHGIEINDRLSYVSENAYKNRRSNYNIWGCSLFDNEQEAIKSFG